VKRPCICGVLVTPAPVRHNVRLVANMHGDQSGAEQRIGSAYLMRQSDLSITTYALCQYEVVNVMLLTGAEEVEDVER